MPNLRFSLIMEIEHRKRVRSMNENTHLELAENCYIDKNLKRLFVEGSAIKLTPREYRTIEYLVSNAGISLSHDQLAEHIVNDYAKYEALESTESYVRNYISKVKKHLPEHVKREIQTVPVHGYVFKPTSPQQKPVINDQPEIMTYNQLINLGWTALKIADALVANDYALFDITPESEGTPEQWAQFLSHYQDSFLYLLHKNKIVGNFSLTVLKEHEEEQILNGTLNSSTLSIKDHYIGPSTKSQILYVLNLSVNEGYTNAKYRRLLSDSLILQLTKWAKDGIFFDRIYAHAYNDVSCGWFEYLGFSEIKNVQNQFTKTATLFCLNPFPDNFEYYNEELLYSLKYAYDKL